MEDGKLPLDPKDTSDERIRKIQFNELVDSTREHEADDAKAQAEIEEMKKKEKRLARELDNEIKRTQGNRATQLKNSRAQQEADLRRKKAEDDAYYNELMMKQTRFH